MNIEITKVEKINLVSELRKIQRECYEYKEYDLGIDKLIDLIENAKKGDAKLK